MIEFNLFRSSNEGFDAAWREKLENSSGTPEMGGKNRLIGVRESAKAISRNLAECVFLAEDADSTVVAPLLDECRIRGIEIVFVPSKAALGDAVGIDVSASIVTILKAVPSHVSDV